jgi:hypothetical protein
MPHQAYGRAQYSSWYNFRRSTNLLWTSRVVPGQNILSVHETLPITAKTSRGSMEHKAKQGREFAEVTGTVQYSTHVQYRTCHYS